MKTRTLQAQAEIARASATIAHIANLWACRYTVESIQREVPSIEHSRIIDILNLLGEVAADQRGIV